MAPPGYRPERHRARLVGREAELGLLCNGVENAIRNTRGALLLLLGEAGVGKSRLAEELARHAADEHHALVLEGRCVPYGEANIWWPVADALRHGAGIRSSDPADKAIDMARRSVSIALGDDATADEVDRVHHGLLYLMGTEIEQKESDWVASEAALEEAARVFAETGDASGGAEVLRLRGFAALFRHQYAAATFEEIGDKGGLQWAQGLLAWARFQQGHFAEAGEMAESLLTTDRRTGDRWALGMMLVLAGSVRLWTGRTLSAIDRLDEARELFEEIHDRFGGAQSTAVLGRALVLAGRVDEGLEMVASITDSDEGPLSVREEFVPVMAGLAATVQVGDLERSERLLSIFPGGPVGGETGELIVGDTEQAASVGLHRLQSGDVPGALALVESLHQRLLPRVDPNLESTLALAHAADGAIEAALVEADAVDAHERATYLDRIVAGIARGLALARRPDAEAAAAARMSEAEDRLAVLGITKTSWRRVFALGMGVPA